MYEVFSTRTGNVIATVPTWILAAWICRRLEKNTQRFAYDWRNVA
jgi:hypothetical protein